MQNNVVSQNKHMYSLYMGSLFNVAFHMTRLHRDFTGIRGNLNAMKHSIELCLLKGQSEKTSAFIQCLLNSHIFYP